MAGDAAAPHDDDEQSLLSIEFGTEESLDAEIEGTRWSEIKAFDPFILSRTAVVK
jgi:hypothetical protein